MAEEKITAAEDKGAKGGGRKGSDGPERARSVVRSPEREPQGSTDVVDPQVPEVPDTEHPHGGHHHLEGAGPANTPAGAHVHAPGETPHVHLPPPAPPDTFVVQPPPVGEDDAARKAEASDATYTVDADCKAVIDGQLVSYRRGERVSGRVGQYLADTGAPVSKA